MSETYSARLDGRRVVVRRILPGVHPAVCQRFDGAWARLQEAGSFPAVLEGSPGAVVRAHVQGVNLAQLLEVLAGPPDRRLGLTLASAVCEALLALHRTGGAHGHLCLENFILSAAGEVVLTDAGLSPFALGASPATGNLAAPEQRAGGPSEAPGDVFAAAGLVHLLAPGRISAGLDEILERALSPWAADRPGIEALAHALEAELSAHGGRAAPYEIGELVSERFPHPELPPPDMEPGREMVVEVASLSATGKVEPGRAASRVEEPVAAPPSFRSEVPLELDLAPPVAEEAPPPPAPRRPFPRLLVVGALGLVVLAAGWLALRPASPRATALPAATDDPREVVVFVDVSPDGASVFLGGEPAGTTPLALARPVPEGELLEVRVEKDGYLPLKLSQGPSSGRIEVHGSLRRR